MEDHNFGRFHFPYHSIGVGLLCSKMENVSGPLVVYSQKISPFGYGIPDDVKMIPGVLSTPWASVSTTMPKRVGLKGDLEQQLCLK